MDSDQSTLTRRAFVRTAAGTTGTSAALATTGAATAQEATTHTVDMTDGLVFDPDSLSIAPGDTVVWQNVGSIGHSMTAYEDDIPDAATYFASGGFEGEDAARSAYPDGDIPGGESFEHTFTVEGTYGYFCIPHEGAGMLGEITVGAGGGGTPTGGRIIPQVPDSARALALGSAIAIGSVLFLAYFFMKYGGDYSTEED
jgi:plastocyanin